MSIHTANLGIMSCDTFKNRTKATRAVGGFASKFKSRGNNMAGIDHALEEWERHYGGHDTLTKFGCMVELKKACEGWLARKGSKKSNLANARRQTIKELYLQASKAVQYLGRKYDASKMSRGTRVAHPLHGNYGYERRNYLEQGKAANPVAASDIDMALDLDVSQVLYQQYASSGAAKVSYYNRARRMEFMSMVDGGLIYAGEGADQPMSAEVTQNSITNIFEAYARMYAMDRYGNLFTRHYQTSQSNGTYFNHSSFCAGREVMCAGTLICMDGQLKYISNLSGHYKPTPPDLKATLALLVEEHVDISATVVQAFDAQGPRVLKATTFMQNIRAASDWPDVNAVNGSAFITHNGARLVCQDPY